MRLIEKVNRTILKNTTASENNIDEHYQYTNGKRKVRVDSVQIN